MKRLLLALIVGAFVATPAMADLFNFTVNPTETTFDTAIGVFTANEVEGATGANVARLITPFGTALFDTSWGGPEDFDLSMVVSGINITGTAAAGNGQLSLTDIDDDVISANYIGTWSTGSDQALFFEGALYNVFFSPLGVGDNTAFNGDVGAAPMSFTQLQPWIGAILELTTANPLLRFTQSWGLDANGSVLSGAVSGTVVPVPAALLLGVLGLGAAGMKLRRFV